ncbi:MAG: phenylalanine--tRNA ligase beta subunit-related protein [Candidatus Bathyarchaeota archaeon]|nr:phenylalanine--tRNA ligase beta subunit-related protein [Candidatus Bathyarchaeota archaeon]MDH4292167.1 phenylalanine--tRNA ligase beta subunit-related protein [Dehalococcoidia bacterium]MDH5419227.1 phenylalanine--tRNA ligase beta subunit-related protein [Candidatus Bathyarchaeota archaeon]MDH5635107.1 phenylalanine--tRNA ligase beta subunit-related protein [Candidatus Bathyarchaeota archaeon]MDH5701288.1 phenylalanine--tRNA ligase beta subunit-related protein [Candidatus Bathyarchaeota ar
MNLKIDAQLKTRFSDLTVLTCNVKDVKVKKQNVELEKFKDEIMEKVREKYDLDSAKNLPTFRAYRDFFWRVGIDPTKNRPAAEALIRRILGGKTIPRINTLVDAYNLASIKTEIALAAFDANKLKGGLIMRFAEKTEKFLGIGMEKPMLLQGGEIVVSDSEKLVAIYPYRDADSTKITDKTKNVMLLVCGVPGIAEETLQNAAQVALDYITRFCGGEGKI